MDGVCAIKPEFVVTIEPALKKRKLDDRPAIETASADGTGPAEDGSVLENKGTDGNQIKESKRSKKGQNKSRRAAFRTVRNDNLCKTLYNGLAAAPVCPFEKCKFIHDIEKYLSDKPADVGKTCYIYSTKGFCARGLTCRFAGAHIDGDLNNLKSDKYDELAPKTTLNQISFELQATLRKKTYSFDKSKEIIAEMDKLKADNKELATKKLAGFAPDTDVIAERPREKKKIDFREKLLLSPLTTVGNLPFRRICKEYGADITCGEMACSVPLINGISQEWALAKRHVSEDIFGVQLCGNSPQLVAYATQVIKENCEVDFIDLNLGCPIELIYGQGAGSALIRRVNILEIMVRSCSAILGNTPFTVKTRTGIYANKSVAHELVPKFEEWGAAAVTIHGRSREQRYTKTADWAYIEECASKAKEIPVFGNGDVLCFEDYQKAREAAPSISGVMIGRGGLIKPWIFKEIKEQKHFDPSSSERFEMMRRFVNYGLEHWGSDTQGVENTRRFLLEWQSFMYRYVPYGLLANPPQRINERPESYVGRDDLETLMASSNCSDWVKLSEMLLGPVPDGFNFLPKHKANSF